eukprot:1525808-Amphidinium_carterae.1
MDSENLKSCLLFHGRNRKNLRFDEEAIAKELRAKAGMRMWLSSSRASLFFENKPVAFWVSRGVFQGPSLGAGP